MSAGLTEILEDDEKKKRLASQFNANQYKDLLTHIGGLKDNVEGDRKAFAAEKKRLENEIITRNGEHKAIAKELSTQLRCAGRSYQTLLEANRQITRQMEKEGKEALEKQAELEKIIQDQERSAKRREKELLLEVERRDDEITALKNVKSDWPDIARKLQEDLKAMEIDYEKKLVDKEVCVDQIMKEMQVVTVLIDEQKEKYEKEYAELDRSTKLEMYLVKKQQEKVVLEKDEEKVKVESVIAGLQAENAQLKDELNKVDITPYIKQVEAKEAGYKKLIQDFNFMQQKSHSEADHVRERYEKMLQNITAQVKVQAKQHQKAMAELEIQVKEKQDEIQSLMKYTERLKAEEEIARQQAHDREMVLEDEIKAAREALFQANNDCKVLQRRVEKWEDKWENRASEESKVRLIEMQMEELVQQFEMTISMKDEELARGMQNIADMQERLAEEKEQMQEIELMWETRIQKKEEGYNRLAGDLQFCQGQLEDERRRVEEERRNVKRLEEYIEKIKGEFEVELEVRQVAYDQRLVIEQELFAQIEEIKAREDPMRAHYEAIIDKNWHDREAAEFQLKIEIKRRDRQKKALEQQLKAVQEEFETARAAWDEKEREIEMVVRNRDRSIAGLKNEIEFQREAWEEKYGRLLKTLEKLQKEFDEAVGPGGAAEARRRAELLKRENERLRQIMIDMQNKMKDLQRRIRELELEVDEVRKECADLISVKEKAMAELAGEAAALEQKLEKQKELQEQLIKEKDLERAAQQRIWQARVAQLEQQVEAMRFTDREELIGQITKWKRLFEVKVQEKEDVDEQCTELLTIKDVQLQKMVQENTDMRDEIKKKELEWEEQKEEIEKANKNRETQMKIKQVDIEKQLLDVTAERNEVKREMEKQMLDIANMPDDPEKIALREEVQLKEKQIEASQVALKTLVAEAQVAETKVDEVREPLEKKIAEQEEAIKADQKVIDKLKKEHEELKDVLQMEMMRAEETCRILEKQFRELPNPFEEEMNELREKYAETQKGLKTVQDENFLLSSKIEEQKKEFEIKEAELTEKIVLASNVLNEVSSLGVIQGLSLGEIRSLEESMGIDLDGDGVVG
eukprot:gnl/MRDRNA2_/MRDRNA2_29394_c0_seq1.p1 gnl/MRDRNA2_/MRDRNA2_29394_c0~~gnl/MRDRNA2_/MRDRNA2_29394_c0_seq1.p1  ORF type:complete len:1088 (-),score=435.29 gnl/MRDRNA2_/MRDRNA2_29394_c0_seq1:56-3319(-)